jgi:hypothetical protein
MIRRDLPEGRQIHLFTTPIELELLQEMATEEDAWTEVPGGFEADVREDLESGDLQDRDWLYDLGIRALDEIRRFTGINELGDDLRARFLFCPMGTVYPRAPEPAPEGQRLVRLDLMIIGPGKDAWLRSWQAGDALLYYPGAVKLEETTLIGRVLLLSVEVLVQV